MIFDTLALSKFQAPPPVDADGDDESSPPAPTFGLRNSDHKICSEPALAEFLKGQQDDQAQKNAAAQEQVGPPAPRRIGPVAGPPPGWNASSSAVSPAPTPTVDDEDSDDDFGPARAGTAAAANRKVNEVRGGHHSRPDRCCLVHVLCGA